MSWTSNNSIHEAKYVFGAVFLYVNLLHHLLFSHEMVAEQPDGKGTISMKRVVVLDWELT